MNGELIRKAAIYTLGFAIGAGAGYALSSFIYDNMVEEEFEEEFLEDEEELEEDDIETVVPEPHKKRERKKVDYNAMYNKEGKPDLNSLVKNIRQEVEAGIEELDETPDPTKPYLITRVSYEEEFQAHQKVVYHYYEEDDILTNAENETVITANPDKFLGPDALDSFGQQELDPDFVHVRNEVLGVDYEIQIIHGSFEQAIQGIKEKIRTTRKKKPVIEEEDEE